MLRVLLVDDTRFTRVLLTSTLEEAGCAVEAVDGGRAALERVAAAPPDVILCDFEMPDMNGIGLVEALQTQAPNVPAVMLTSHENVELCVSALRAGAYGYVLKNAPVALLVRELERAYEQGRLAAKNRALEELSRQHQLELERKVEEKTSELMKLERLRAQADRMSALGTLVAGVAHEINSPLAAIKSNLTWLEEVAPELCAKREQSETDAAALPQVLLEMQQAVERVARITAALKRIAQPGHAAGHVSVDKALQDAELQCQARLQDGTSLSKDVPRDLPPVALPREDLATGITQLLLNAVHALGSRGGQIRVSAANSGDAFVSLSIHDNGCGIPPEHLARVKEPFFTTKDPGTGVGLGLTLVDQIVAGAGGRLEIESRLGEGTTVRLLLPVATAVSADAVKAASGRLRA